MSQKVMKMFWGGDEDCNETYLKYEEDENVPTLQQIPHSDCSEPGRYQPAGGVCLVGHANKDVRFLPLCPFVLQPATRGRTLPFLGDFPSLLRD